MTDALRPLHAQERIIAWRLAEGRCVPLAELIGALWGDREDGGAETAERVVHVRLTTLRRALEPLGIGIRNVYRLGWEVAPSDVLRLRDLLADEIARNVRIGYRKNRYTWSAARRARYEARMREKA